MKIIKSVNESMNQWVKEWRKEFALPSEGLNSLRLNSRPKNLATKFFFFFFFEEFVPAKTCMPDVVVEVHAVVLEFTQHSSLIIHSIIHSSIHRFTPTALEL